MGTGGIRVNMIPKEGGNTFKGTFFLNGANNSFQSDNLTASLEQQRADRRQQGEEGLGRQRLARRADLQEQAVVLLRDQVLGSRQVSRRLVLRCRLRSTRYTQDLSRRGVDDSWNLSNAARLTWQATAAQQGHRVQSTKQDRLTGHWFVGQGGIFGLTTPEASWIQRTPIGHLLQGKWTSTVSGRMLIEAGVSLYDQEYCGAAAGRHAYDAVGARQRHGPAHQRGPVHSEHFSDAAHVHSLHDVRDRIPRDENRDEPERRAAARDRARSTRT